MTQQTDHIGDINKMVTAVEWLIDKVEDHFCLLPVDLVKQAKQMEKDQIVDAWHSSHVSTMTGEQYYNETYNK